jgi:biopolymer transport protein ExbB
MLSLILVQAGQNFTEAAQVTSKAVQHEGLMKEIVGTVMKSGPIMIPIVLLSMVAIFIFLERYIVILKAGRVDSRLMTKLKEYIQDGKIDSASSLCHKNNTATSRMIGNGISRIGRSFADVNSSIESFASLEVSRLEKRLPLLASVVGGAPMLGILGTVIGIIQAFSDMVKSGNTIDLTLILTSVYQTLGTTIIGFIVGLVAYFAYNILVATVQRVIFNLKSANSEFMDMLNEQAK